jgi:cytochrome P450
MKEVAFELLGNAKKLAISQEKGAGANSTEGRDLLSILVRANLNADGPELSDEEVVDRECTRFSRVRL